MFFFFKRVRRYGQYPHRLQWEGSQGKRIALIQHKITWNVIHLKLKLLVQASGEPRYWIFCHHRSVVLWLSQLIPSRKQQPQQRIEYRLNARYYETPTWRGPAPWIQESKKEAYEMSRILPDLWQAINIIANDMTGMC